MIPKFRGEIKDNKLHLKEREKYQKWIEKLEGKEVFVTVEKKKLIRSLSQNALYHLWVRVIAEDRGYEEPEEVCYALKKLLMPEKWGEIKDILGQVIPVIPSTKDLDSGEMMEFVTKVQFWSAKEGIILPNPDDLSNPVLIHKEK